MNKNGNLNVVIEKWIKSSLQLKITTCKGESLISKPRKMN